MKTPLSIVPELCLKHLQPFDLLISRLFESVNIYAYTKKSSDQNERADLRTVVRNSIYHKNGKRYYKLLNITKYLKSAAVDTLQNLWKE